MRKLKNEDSSLNILFVMDSLFTGGAEYSTLLLIEWLKLKGHDVSLVLLKDKTPSYDLAKFNLNGVRVVRLSSSSFLSRLLELRKIIIVQKPDIVHSVLTTSNFVSRCVRIFYRKFIHIESLVNQPYSAIRLNDKSLKPWKIKVLKYFDQFSHKHTVQHFHANSVSVAKHYHNEINVSEDKITVIPRGRPENLWLKQKQFLREQLIHNLGIPSDKVIIINTGRHEHQKGHDVLLKAISICKTKNQFFLLIAGREGAKTPELKRLINEYGLSNRVILLGHRTDVPQLLAASDLFVFPSRYEGMPGALIEACAAGLPVICTDLPCMEEVVNKGSNALFITLDNVIELATKIDDMINNNDIRNSMSVKSIDIFHSKFNINQIHQKFAAMYNHILLR
jgi:glycosyltransferase involved in cell wall biosynthesis